jgi:hypothetical protein
LISVTSFFAAACARRQSRAGNTRVEREVERSLRIETHVEGIAVSLKDALELPANIPLGPWKAQAFSCSADDGPVLVHGLSPSVSRRVHQKRGLVVLPYLVKSIVNVLGR